MVFRAISKLMLSYSEQQRNQFRYLEQYGNLCPSFRDQYFGNLGFEPNFQTKIENLNASLIYALIGSILWNNIILCNSTLTEQALLKRSLLGTLILHVAVEVNQTKYIHPAAVRSPQGPGHPLDTW